MGKSSFRLEIDNIDKFKRLMRDGKEPILRDAGKFVTSEQKKITPVDTGKLRESLREAMKNKDTINVGTDVEYSDDVEFGNSRQSAQPYFLPGYERNQEGVKSLIRSRIKDLMEGS